MSEIVQQTLHCRCGATVTGEGTTKSYAQGNARLLAMDQNWRQWDQQFLCPECSKPKLRAFNYKFHSHEYGPRV